MMDEVAPETPAVPNACPSCRCVLPGPDPTPGASYVCPKCHQAFTTPGQVTAALWQFSRDHPVLFVVLALVVVLPVAWLALGILNHVAGRVLR